MPKTPPLGDMMETYQSYQRFAQDEEHIGRLNSIITGLEEKLAQTKKRCKELEKELREARSQAKKRARNSQKNSKNKTRR